MTSLSDIIDGSIYALAPDVLLTPDGPQHDSVILVVDGQITDVATRAEFSASYSDIDVCDLRGQAIIPGFIDAHIHLGQGFGKAIIGGEPAQIWQRIWIPLEGNLDPELVYISAKWMLLEALRGGFTAVVNFAILNLENAKAIHQAAIDTGIRLVSSTGAVDKAAYDDVTGSETQLRDLDFAYERAEGHLDLCNAHKRIYPSLCVSGVQGASKELIKGLSGLAANNGALFQIHANEHIPEVHASIVEYGRRPIEYIADAEGLGIHTLLHHGSLVTEAEIELIRTTESGVSYNPVASLWKGDAVAPATAYAERGVRMGMGTDSTRSDGFRMLDAAEACQRVAFGMRVNDYSAGAAWTWVEAATQGSADVAGLGDVTGKLAKGYGADFLILDMNQPETMPSWDFQWELVRLYNRDQIRGVVIDGDLVMKDGRATAWDQDQFLKDELPKAVSAVETAPIVRRHGPSTDHRQTTLERRARDQ